MADLQIRVAIIGLGHIGRIHVAALQQTAGLELVAGCDNDTSLSTLLPIGIPFYSTYSAMLDQGGFDTVIVATPNCTHNAIALDVLRRGFHVVVEKPAGADMRDIVSLENMARQKKCHVYYAFHAALAQEVDWLVDHLGKYVEKYGALTSFLCQFYDPYVDIDDQLVAHALSLGDCWYDSGVNALSVLHRFLPVDKLQMAYRRQSGRYDLGSGIRSASVGFHFPVHGDDSVGFGVIDTAWDQGCNYKATTLNFGNTGWRILIDHSFQRVTSWSPQGEELELVSFEGERLLNHYLALFADYSKRFREGGVMNSEAAQRVHTQFFRGKNN